MKRWCVINLSEIREPRIFDPVPLFYEILDKKYGPRCFYPDRESAENALMFMTETYGEGFYLFEAVATVHKFNQKENFYYLKEI